MERGLEYGRIAPIKRESLLKLLKTKGKVKFISVASHDSTPLPQHVVDWASSTQQHTPEQCGKQNEESSTQKAADATVSAEATATPITPCPVQMCNWVKKQFESHQQAMGSKLEIPLYTLAIESHAAGAGNTEDPNRVDNFSLRSIFQTTQRELTSSLPPGSLIVHIAPSALTSTGLFCTGAPCY